MIKGSILISRKKLLLIPLIIIVSIVAGIYLSSHNKSSTKTVEYPEYFSFDGKYVFGVPKGYTIDEQSIPGIVFVYRGQIMAKNADDLINQGGVAIEPIKDLSDHSSKGFKKYVNDNFLPELKKNLSTNNVEVKFDKRNGQDTALITIDKASKPYRYVKSGRHPAVVVYKHETDEVKHIQRTLIDLEVSDLNKELDGISNMIKSTVQLVKNQKIEEIYTTAAPELQNKNKDQLGNILRNAAPYTTGTITINGFSYSLTDFTVAMRMTVADNNQKPALGGMAFNKIDGQWKIASISLPSSVSQ